MTDARASARFAIQSRYGEIARTRATAPVDACCEASEGATCSAPTIPYSASELAALPRGAFLALGTGAPVRHAALREGETVLDLGSGAGVDAFLASRAVGPTGRVLGVDFTPDMVRRAHRSAREGGYSNVSFHEAPIERLPLPDGSVDVVVSNCVINLSVDKPAVLAEARRVLKPGGRLVVSDTLRLGGGRASESPSCDCTTGALSPDEWTRMLAEAGFRDASVVIEGTNGCCGGSGDLGRGIIRAGRP